MRPLFVPRESVASNLQKPAVLQNFLLAASREIYGEQQSSDGSSLCRFATDSMIMMMMIMLTFIILTYYTDVYYTDVCYSDV